VWLGKLIHDFDGLITKSRALHQTFSARVRKKNHHPPRPPPKRNESLLKQITATLYCEVVNAFGAAAPFSQCTLCCNEVASIRVVVGADGGFFPLHEQQRADVGSGMLFSDRQIQG
jgi:hypothetical protein